MRTPLGQETNYYIVTTAVNLLYFVKSARQSQIAEAWRQGSEPKQSPGLPLTNCGTVLKKN